MAIDPFLGSRKTRRPERTFASASRIATITRARRPEPLWRTRLGASITAIRMITGAKLARKSRSELVLKRSVVETMIAPSIASATRLSTVCETIVPRITGSVSRIRPVRRAMIIARAGSPARAGSVADISTPIIVAEVTSRRRIRRSGSAERIAANQEIARMKRLATIRAKASRTHDFVVVDDVVDNAVDADPARGCPGERRRPQARRRRSRPGGRPAAAAAAAGSGSRLGSFSGATGGEPSAGDDADPARGGLEPGRRLGSSEGVLVDLGHLVGDPRPRVVLGGAQGRLAHRPPPLVVDLKLVERLGHRLGVGGRDEQSVDAVVDDLAVAGDLGRDDRGSGRERLDQDHAEALTG